MLNCSASMHKRKPSPFQGCLPSSLVRQRQFTNACLRHSRSWNLNFSPGLWWWTLKGLQAMPWRQCSPLQRCPTVYSIWARVSTEKLWTVMDVWCLVVAMEPFTKPTQKESLLWGRILRGRILWRRILLGGESSSGANLPEANSPGRIFWGQIFRGRILLASLSARTHDNNHYFLSPVLSSEGC